MNWIKYPHKSQFADFCTPIVTCIYWQYIWRIFLITTTLQDRYRRQLKSNASWKVLIGLCCKFVLVWAARSLSQCWLFSCDENASVDFISYTAEIFALSSIKCRYSMAPRVRGSLSTVATGQETDMSDNMTRYFCNLLMTCSSAYRILENYQVQTYTFVDLI